MRILHVGNVGFGGLPGSQKESRGCRCRSFGPVLLARYLGNECIWDRFGPPFAASCSAKARHPNAILHAELMGMEARLGT